MPMLPEWPPTLSPFRYELWQNDVIVAVVSGDDQETVLSNVLAGVDRAEADGPVDVYRVLRVKVILPPRDLP